MNYISIEVIEKKCIIQQIRQLQLKAIIHKKGHGNCMYYFLLGSYVYDSVIATNILGYTYL